MKNLSTVALVLTVVGGINWGLVGIQMLGNIGNLNLVNLLVGRWSIVEALVYVLVGISALLLAKECYGKKCKM